MQSKLNVVYFPAFNFHKPSHGGTLRSAQVNKLLAKKYPNLKTYEFNLNQIFKKHFIEIVFYFLLSTLKQSKLSIKGKLKYSTCIIYLKKLKIDPNSIIHIEQSPNNLIYLSSALVDMGLKFELYPHNIEFCVSGQSFKNDGEHYELIKKSFLHAYKIHLISEFDLQIASIFNENCFLLEYQSPSLVSFNNKVQKKEKIVFSKKIPKNFFLSFGTFSNPPTSKGMLKLINNYNNMKFSEEGPLVITGYDSYKFSCDKENIIILGSVSNLALEKLIKLSNGIIIFQAPTTGWLTKIDYLKNFNKTIYINQSYYQISNKNYDLIKTYEL